MDFSSLAWLAVIPALGFLVVVHELGHYWVGRKMGIKIEEFGIGLPPRAKVLFVRKGIPFTLNWLPLGGFVRFAGEEGGFDDPDSLASAPPRRRIPVMAAGVIANVITAIIMFAIIFAIWGYPNLDKVMVASTDEFASKAGFVVEDVFVSINGSPISTDEQVRQLVETSAGKPVSVVVQRDGVEQTLSVTPQYSAEAQRYRFGVGLGNPRESVNIFQAIVNGFTYSFRLLGEMFMGFAMLIGGLLGTNPAPEGGLAGPVGIARLTGQVARSGLRDYLNFTALLSLNLALINILPIPALDGSRIIFALIEAIRRKKIPPEREAVVHAIGMMMLLGLMLLVTVSDVRNIISGEPAITMPPTPTPIVRP
ncbi:M50 family metallopeptidase [Herpetosiphon sp. NSE202]|uniref:M50 family metallopeptidase n=1 Tax=Herpetosiphon sp. NSE202 TaxID=3351349 RepID=UPI00362B420A